MGQRRLTAHERKLVDATAEELCAYLLPTEWYDDPHGLGKHPRCCESTKLARKFLAQLVREVTR